MRVNSHPVFTACMNIENNRTVTGEVDGNSNEDEIKVDENE